MNAVVDNDIIFKGACYGMLEQLVSVVCSNGETVGILGAARFVLSKKMQKMGKTTAEASFRNFLRRAELLETTNEEQRMAADLELIAQKQSLNLDAGESQLCTIVVYRLVPLLLSGDKRAIEAIDKLLDCYPKLSGICGKVKCLEQLILAILTEANVGTFRTAICREPGVDKALTICFSCSSDAVPSTSFFEGLNSYVSALRVVAGRVLTH